MKAYNLQITAEGKFTCDACEIIHDLDNVYTVECPDFDTLEEVVEWVKGLDHGSAVQ